MEDSNVVGVAVARAAAHVCLRPSMSRESAVAILADFFRGKKISSVAGEKSSADAAIESLARLGALPAQTNEYELLALESGAAIPKFSPPAGFKVERCSIGDARALLALQAAYEMEEVVPPCRTFSEAAALKRLERSLPRRAFFALRAPDGAFAAKANESATGFRAAQIGGVFTDKKFRGRNFASLVVSELCREISGRGMAVSLFSRAQNEAASRLYRRLGFKKIARFVIAYY